MILIVEDDRGDADYIQEALLANPRGRGVKVVTTLADARAKLCGSASGVRAVLLDLHLPDASGVEAVRALRTTTPNMPIVVLIGADDDQLALACIDAGAQDYLPKVEMRSTTLLRAIEYAVARSREATERLRADVLQAQLAAIVEISSDAIMSTTTTGEITSWNRGAEKIFGRSAADAIGKPASELLLVPAHAEGGLSPTPFDRLSRDELESVEVVGRRTDGRALVLSLSVCQLHGMANVAPGFAAICRDVTESRRRDAEIRQSNTELMKRDGQLRTLTARLAAVREEERRRIASAVHDELGQLLTGLKLDLAWVTRRVAAGTIDMAGVGEKLRDVGSLVDGTLEAVQRIAADLRPTALDSCGLSVAIREEARLFQLRTGVTTEVVASSSAPDSETAIALYRIFQELLTNVARHSHATELEVVLDEGEQTWVLRVSDNGIGISGYEEVLASSLGLLGMRERAESLAGSFVIERRPGGGTTAIVEVPRSAAAIAG